MSGIFVVLLGGAGGGGGGVVTADASFGGSPISVEPFG
jgi:hypothetical protein